MSFNEIVSAVSDFVWSPALIVVCLGAGLLFSILTKFVQVRRFGEMVRLLFSKDKTHKSGGISSFQAFAMALSGRVGTGNIVGVATAIAFGGPGAIFWMWVIAFFGAGSAFVESTLAQIYKVKIESELRGGPSYYIHKGLKSKWLAVIFAICAIIACGFFLPSVQSNGVAIAFYIAMNIKPIYIGVALSFLLSCVIIGGVKRIANVARIVAPFMAIAYLALALIIVFCNIGKLPEVFSLIFSAAFGTHQVYGAILGTTIMWGVKRGIFSNEAGQGTGPIVAAAAKVSHPAKQGLVQAFSVYVDTLLVCTATAVMILSTGMYNVFDSEGNVIMMNAPNIADQSVSFTQSAIETIMPGTGNLFVAISLSLFVFTTLMAYYYYAETSIVFLTRKKSYRKLAINILRLMTMFAVCFGAVKETALAWQLGDIGVGMMAWINIISILILFPTAIRTLKDYESQKKMGIEPEFNPDKLNIKNADYWHEKNKNVNNL